MNYSTDLDHRKSVQKRTIGQNTCDLCSSTNPLPHLIHFHPRTTFQSRQWFEHSFLLTMSLHLLSPAGPPIAPTWACYLIKRYTLESEYILSQSNRSSDEIGRYLIRIISETTSPCSCRASCKAIWRSAYGFWTPWSWPFVGQMADIERWILEVLYLCKQKLRNRSHT